MSTHPTDLPGYGRFDRTIPVPLPAVVLVDAEGDEWAPAGRTDNGDLLVVCEAPQSPEDQGDGPSAPWTRSAVEARFGPVLVRRLGGAA